MVRIKVTPKSSIINLFRPGLFFGLIMQDVLFNDETGVILPAVIGSVNIDCSEALGRTFDVNTYTRWLASGEIGGYFTIKDFLVWRYANLDAPLNSHLYDELMSYQDDESSIILGVPKSQLHYVESFNEETKEFVFVYPFKENDNMYFLDYEIAEIEVL